MFGQTAEDGNFKSSIIGDAVIHDLRGKSMSAAESISTLSEKLKVILSTKSMANNSLENTNVLRRIGAMMYSFFIEPFVPVKPASPLLTDEEKSSIHGLVNRYREIEDSIFKYSLEENLVPAIVQEFMRSRIIGNINLGPLYDLRIDPTLLEKKVIPDLQALGMADLLPILREQLEKEGLIGDLEMASQEGHSTVDRGTGIGENGNRGR